MNAGVCGFRLMSGVLVVVCGVLGVFGVDACARSVSE